MPHPSEPVTVGFPDAETPASEPPATPLTQPVAAAAAVPSPEAASPVPSAAEKADGVAVAPVGPPAVAEAATAVPEGDEGHSSASLAEALRRGIAAETSVPATGDVPAPAARLPHSPGESRLSAQQLRTERPLVAPQPPAPAAPVPAAPAGDGTAPAGLPATELPPVVEPQVNLPETTEPDPDTAVAASPGDQAAIRNRRLYRRVGLDADFEVDGAAGKLIDLSMGGFAVANLNPLATNVVVPVVVRLSIDGVEIRTRMRARIIYTNVLRSGGRFIDLTASQTAFLRYVVTWRGRAHGALGTTTLLDAITRTPERGRSADTPAPAGQPQRAPWWSRWFGRLLGPRRAATD